MSQEQDRPTNLNQGLEAKTMDPPPNSDRVLKFTKSRVFYFIMVFAYCMFTMILSIIQSTLFPSISQNLDYEYFIKNWEQDLITDIKIAYDPDLCPNSYTPIFEFETHGMDYGCDCRFVHTTDQQLYNLQPNVYRGDCTDAMLLVNKCYEVKKIQPAKIFNWFVENEYPEKKFKICAKRLSNYNFANQKGWNQNCKSGQKLCGSSQSLYQYCIDATENCPINYLSFGLLNDNTTELSELNISSTKSIYHSRKENLNPIVDFRVSQGQGVCLKNDKFNYDYARNLHPLSLFQDICSQVDSRFVALDSISESSFFYANNQYQDTIDNPQSDPANIPLVGKISSQDFKISIYYRRVINWNQNCYGNLLNNAIKYKNRFIQIKISVQVQMIINIVYFILVWICLGGIIISSEDHQQKWGLIFLKVVLFMCHGSVVLTNFIFITQFYNFLQSVVKAQCSDAQTIKIFTDYISLLNVRIKLISDVIFFGFIGYFVLELISLFIVCVQFSSQKDKSAYLINHTSNIVSQQQAKFQKATPRKQQPPKALTPLDQAEEILIEIPKFNPQQNPFSGSGAHMGYNKFLTQNVPKHMFSTKFAEDPSQAQMYKSHQAAQKLPLQEELVGLRPEPQAQKSGFQLIEPEKGVRQTQISGQATGQLDDRHKINLSAQKSQPVDYNPILPSYLTAEQEEAEQANNLANQHKLSALNQPALNSASQKLGQTMQGSLLKQTGVQPPHAQYGEPQITKDILLLKQDQPDGRMLQAPGYQLPSISKQLEGKQDFDNQPKTPKQPFDLASQPFSQLFAQGKGPQTAFNNNTGFQNSAANQQTSQTFFTHQSGKNLAQPIITNQLGYSQQIENRAQKTDSKKEALLAGNNQKLGEGLVLKQTRSEYYDLQPSLMDQQRQQNFFSQAINPNQYSGAQKINLEQKVNYSPLNPVPNTNQLGFAPKNFDLPLESNEGEDLEYEDEELPKIQKKYQN